MTKYAVMVVLDLDIELLDDFKASEVEEITKERVKIEVETRGSGGRGVGEIKMIRTKLLGLVEDTK